MWHNQGIMSTLSAQQIKHFKAELLALQKDLQDILQNSQAATATVDLDQSRLGRVSRIDAMQQQAMAKAEQINFEKRLKLIASALNKIAKNDSSYSHCEDCDEVISLARLSIKPESQFCIQCQQYREM